MVAHTTLLKVSCQGSIILCYWYSIEAVQCVRVCWGEEGGGGGGGGGERQFWAQIFSSEDFCDIFLANSKNPDQICMIRVFTASNCSHTRLKIDYNNAV